MGVRIYDAGNIAVKRRKSRNKSPVYVSNDVVCVLVKPFCNNAAINSNYTDVLFLKKIHTAIQFDVHKIMYQKCSTCMSRDRTTTDTSKYTGIEQLARYIEIL